MFKIKVYTERGVFEGSWQEKTNESFEFAQKAIKEACGGELQTLTVATDNGGIVIGRDLLKTSVFEIIKSE